MGISLPDKIVMRRSDALVNLGLRSLIYPLNTSFIRNLEPVFMGKWMKAGWDIERTVLLELGHMTVPSYEDLETSPASSLFSGVILAWSANKYFRFVAFTDGYYQSVDEVNLRIDCWHEERHMRSAEEFMFSGSIPPTEKEIAQEELKYIYQMFGDDGIRARSQHVSACIEKGRSAEAIPGEVAICLLREFFEEKHANFRSHSNLIPQNRYTARMREMSLKMINHVTRFYKETLRVNPRDVFRCMMNP
jgi:hypothetical protein